MKHKIHSEKELTAFAKQFAQKLSGGEVLLLEGTLGAGKTTFVKALARALGSKDVVTSPTFVLRNDYTTAKFELIHIDLYRLDKQPAGDFEFLESIGEPQTITCVEWPERLSGASFVGKTIRLQFEITGDTTRTITET